MNKYLSTSLALLLMNVYDVAATVDALSRGYHESNPFALWLIETSGFGGLLGFKVFFVGIICLLSSYIASTRHNSIKVVYWISVAVYAALTIFHISNLG